MASAITFGSANSGFQAGIIHGQVHAEFHPPPEPPETPPSPSAVLPFARDRDFVERGELLDQIHEKCAVPGSRTALVGLGGIESKSQLAIEYGYRVEEQSPRTWVFWIHAGSAARLEQSYRDIADYVKVRGRRDPKANILKLVHNWLRDGKNRPWLLILDNVDNVDDTHYAPGARSAGQGVQETGANSGILQLMSMDLPQSQNGSILITSRSKGIAVKLAEERDVIAVEPMAQSHALTLFEKKLGTLGGSEYIAELAAALEYMPLAIVQSAAYVCQRVPRYSVRQYLEDFRKSDRKKTSLLNYEGGQLRRDWEARNSIIITWQISFEHVRRSWPSAADLLSLMSFFDRQGIPESLVRNRSQTEGRHRSQEPLDRDDDEENGDEDGESSMSDSSENDGFEDDVQVLRNYSLISINTDRIFEMHALVQLAMRKWLEANKLLESWKQQYVKNLSAAFPSGEYVNWKSCQVLFPHAKSAITQRPRTEGSLNEWASLMYNAAWYAWARGNAVEAVQLSKVSMEVRKKMLGQEHMETLSSIGMVGLAYNLGGRWKEAEELHVGVMETTKRVLSEEHPDTLTCMSNLASIYSNQGRWKEAEELQVGVMETTKRVLGKEHPFTLNSMGNLASTYRKQGRWKEAEELQVGVMEIRKRVLGEEHPSTLTIMNNLAFTWKAQSQDTKAVNLIQECIRLRNRVLGVDHPDTLSSSAVLAKWQGPETISFVTNNMTITKEEPKRLNEVSDHVIPSKSKRKRI
ncbi:MAG: hypothetical protein Q9195_001654 [Heterodermia aff. obscurata]